MKKQLLSIFAATVLIAQSFTVNAQTFSDFENLTLSADSYWDGSTDILGATFESGNAIFQNYFDTAFGGFWIGGFAYSNVVDSTTAGYMNTFGARTGSGYLGSANYAVGQQNAVVNLKPAAEGKIINGFYVTNSTFAALSMRDGDFVGKQFGSSNDANGTPDGTNGADWFKLSVTGWYNGNSLEDTVHFYLADYRFQDSLQDYILTTWEWVDISWLGNVDSLVFKLSSSDNGSFGMNTPAFFCIDNFTTANSGVSINEQTANSIVSVYPNPTSDFTVIDLSKVEDKNLQVTVTDVQGKLIYSQLVTNTGKVSLNLNAYTSGVYFINITGENTVVNQKLIKR